MEVDVRDELVAAYLDRLRTAAQGLPAERRDELVEEIAGHIEQAQGSGAVADETALRNLLDRLGPPEEIVAAAAEDAVAAPAAPVSTTRELITVLLLTVGSLIPLVGWTVGVVLLWTSTLWSARHKWLGTLVVPLGPFGLLALVGLLALFPAYSCVTVTDTAGNVQQDTCPAGPPAWIAPTLIAVVVVAPFIVAVHLMRVAYRRAGLPVAER